MDSRPKKGSRAPRLHFSWGMALFFIGLNGLVLRIWPRSVLVPFLLNSTAGTATWLVSSTDEVEMDRSVLLWVSFVLLAAEMTAALAVALTYCLLLSGRRSGSVGYAAT